MPDVGTGARKGVALPGRVHRKVARPFSL